MKSFVKEVIFLLSTEKNFIQRDEHSIEFIPGADVVPRGGSEALNIVRF